MSVSVNTTTNTVTIQQDATRIVQVATAGPQGAQGPVATGGTASYVAAWSSANNLTTIPIFISASTIVVNGTGSIHGEDSEAFLVNQISPTSFNLINGHSNVDGYSQIEIQNFSSGENASADIVATRNDGNEDTGYIDMGINSSTYTNTQYVGAAGDAYLYSTGENLYIGNATPGKQVVLFNGGLDANANARVFIHDQGTVGINTILTGSAANPPAMYIVPPSSTTINLITAVADINNYCQFALFNKNPGLYASADIVAQNDLGTETDYYVDMGINSSGHVEDPTFTVGGPNDTYLLSVGGNHYMGSPRNGNVVLFTGENFDHTEHSKLIIKANDQHELSGSLSISGSSLAWNQNQVLTTPSATTGTVISFAANQVYNEWDVPGTGNITDSLTGAKTGIVQKIYHNDSTAPSTPAGWVLVSGGVYVPGTLNIIYAEWVKGTRVEYWITQ